MPPTHAERCRCRPASERCQSFYLHFVMPPNLSKSRFVAGWQCHKQLWLRVHEQDAPGAPGRRGAPGSLRPGRRGGRPGAGAFPRRDADRPAVQRSRPRRGHPLGTRRRRTGGVRSHVHRGPGVRGHRRPRTDRRRVHPHRGQVFHQGQGRAHPRCRHPDLGGSAGRHRRAPGGGDAPQYRLPVPRPGRAVPADRRDRVGWRRSSR